MTVEAPVLRILEKIVGEVDEVLGNTPRVEDYVDSQWVVLEQEQPALAKFLDRRLFHLVVHNDAGAEFFARPHKFSFQLGAVLAFDAARRAGIEIEVKDEDLEELENFTGDLVSDSDWILPKREGPTASFSWFDRELTENSSAFIAYLVAIAQAMRADKLRQDFWEGVMWVLLPFWLKSNPEGRKRPILRLLR